jgi:GDP/UDP-N,N'-diacetylbacillosamine 2-epimerase (hydrolysing)
MKISILTSTRADFGLLKNLIHELKKNKKFSISVIASGSHYAKKYGETYKEIVKNKININEKIVFKSILDNEYGISKTFAQCVEKSTKILKKISPDLFIVLGDRYEVLASVISANILQIPVGHIHGGELTYGSADDGYRHSITKMSHIHFTAHKIYKDRVIQLGENPKKTFVVGGLGVDSLKKTKLLSRKDLEKKFNIKFKKKNYLVCFHPETSKKNSPKRQINEILSALKKIKETCIFFTMPGADLGNSLIEKEIKKFTSLNKNCFFYKSLGQVNYFSFLNQMNAIIGNSSSGILEMPYFRKATINLGDRQLGRLHSKSIINIPIRRKDILNSLKKIYSPSFKSMIKKEKSPYGNGGASVRIVEILKKIKTDNLFQKKFYNIR